MSRIDDLNFDAQGLIPAVVQDAATGEVLTVAYMNAESLSLTRELGETVFFSRSRQSLWHKGETSGNRQKVVSLAVDCDRDALVVRVVPAGPACHTGAKSCFFERVDGFPEPTHCGIAGVLGELQQVIRQRQAERPEGSYTARLFDRGRNRILQKLGEEAVETIIAAMDGSRADLIREASDLLFHLLVSLQEGGVSLDEVAAELRNRRK